MAPYRDLYRWAPSLEAEWERDVRYGLADQDAPDELAYLADLEEDRTA